MLFNVQHKFHQVPADRAAVQSTAGCSMHAHPSHAACCCPQVGPPPGGPASVRRYIPVVFFTARGIPGEVDERLDTLEGITAASMRSMGLSPSAAQLHSSTEAAAESEEAEYAWLPLDCIRPFQPGSGAACGSDPTLQASASAAEAVLEASNAGGTAMDSDSDGGWGIPQPPRTSQQAAIRAARGRGRGRGPGAWQQPGQVTCRPGWAAWPRRRARWAQRQRQRGRRL